MVLSYVVLSIAGILYLVTLIAAVRVSNKEKKYDVKAITALWRTHDLIIGAIIGYLFSGAGGA